MDDIRTQGGALGDEECPPHIELDDPQDEKMCRICHAGVEDGRLISPCSCTGSMKYVHITCLQKWRGMGGDRRYFRCDTCLYEYRVRRVCWAWWLSKAWVIHSITIMVMLVLVIVAGYIGRGLSVVSLEMSQQEVSGLQSMTDNATLPVSQDSNVTESEAVNSSAKRVERQFRASGWSAWSWSFLTVEHWVAGTTVVGVTSFVVLFATLPGVLFRGAELGPLGRGGGSHAAFVIHLIIIVTGVVKAFFALQRLVLAKTRDLVLRAEEHILEVPTG